MERLKNYPSITGDDNPFFSLTLRDLPKGMGFDGLIFSVDAPLTFALKDKLVDFATRYYRNHEIVGTTISDFTDNLQVDLDMNLDTFEKMLQVYDEDIAKPTQSREIVRTYDVTDTNESSSTSEGNNESTNYDIPVDNGTAQGTDKNVGNTTGTSTGRSTDTQSNTAKKTGTETEYWSDVGVAPNYELLNGFLDNNRTLYNVFVSFFKDDFTVMEVYHD